MQDFGKTGIYGTQEGPGTPLNQSGEDELITKQLIDEENGFGQSEEVKMGRGDVKLEENAF